MLEKTKAWYELIKLGNIGSIRKDIDSFFRGNILNVLSNEGLFDYLQDPHSLEEISQEKNYTDLQFLREILDVLVEDNILLLYENGNYILGGPLEYERRIPSVFTEAVVDIWEIHSSFLPERLRGKFMDFTGGFNLFNWDDALTNKMYGQIRKSAFAYSGALKKGGKLLDIGCGNGYGTAAIWSYYYQNNKIDANGNSVEIVGIDPDTNLLEIASSEFSRMVKKHLPDNHYDQELVAKSAPTFIEGTIEAIPYEDNTFDYVYTSQVLHWTDAKKAIEEMLRVTKPGGMVFGTQNLYPDANPYNEMHFKTVKGAGGFFTRDELYTWAEELGVSKITNATPITIFKIIK